MRRKLVVVGKRKLVWTVMMLIAVIVPLMVASYTAPVANVTNPTKMLTYSSEREGIKFDYPQGWLLRTEQFYSGDIIEIISFSSPDGLAHGFVQVMKLSKSIPDFIAETQKSMVPGYDSLQFSQKTINNKEGYLLAYMRGSGDSRAVAAEYFFRENEKVYRFSCFYPELQVEQNQKLFKEMLLSFKYPGGAQKPKVEQNQSQKVPEN